MYYDHDMMNGWNGGGAWGWLFGFFMTLIFVLIGVLVLRYLVREWHSHNQGETALDILQKRYAAGEIDKKEYDEKRKDLKD